MGVVSYNGNSFSNVVSANINLSSGEISLGLNRENSYRTFSIKRGSKIKIVSHKGEKVSINTLKLECSHPVVMIDGEARNITGKHCHIFATGDAMKVESGKVVAGDMVTCEKEIGKAKSILDSSKGREERFRIKGSFDKISIFAGQCNCELSGSILNLETGGTVCVDGNVGVVRCREIYCNRVSGYGLMKGML